MCVTVVVWSLVKMLSQKKVRGTSEIGTVASQKNPIYRSRYLIAAGHPSLALQLVLRKVCAPRRTPISKPGLISSLISRGVRAGFYLCLFSQSTAPTSFSQP